jgi:peptidoglycan/xylan/chitin deacetylase (PgdA/CDA1 family)
MLGAKVRSAFARGFAFVPGFLYGNKSALTLLNYHYFTTGVPASYLEVSLRAFEQQVIAIKASYAVGQVAAQLSSLFAGKLGGPSVSLCVDDGCRSIDSVIPIIEKHSVPITLFVNPGLSSSLDEDDGLRSRVLRRYQEIAPEQRNSRFGEPESCFEMVMGSSLQSLRGMYEAMQPMMKFVDSISVRPLLSLERLKSLASHPLVTVAAHSMSHQRLAGIPAAWRQWEIERSLQYVGEWGGNTQLFAYPYGDPAGVTNDTSAALQHAGVRYAFTTSSYRIYASCDPFRLGRAAMYDVSARSYAVGTVAGAMEFYDRLRLGRAAWQDYAHSARLNAAAKSTLN